MIEIYQFLIFDEHNNHFTSQFNQFYTEYKVISLYMLLHLLYILQSFNVNCFLVLKHLYNH